MNIIIIIEKLKGFYGLFHISEEEDKNIKLDVHIHSLAHLTIVWLNSINIINYIYILSSETLIRTWNESSLKLRDSGSS